jgi:hypothetical protein
VDAPPKPTLVNPSPAPVAEKRDTNKLPPIDDIPKVEIVKPVIDNLGVDYKP